MSRLEERILAGDFAQGDRVRVELLAGQLQFRPIITSERVN